MGNMNCTASDNRTYREDEKSQPVTELIAEHLKTLAEYPPVQGGTSFDMSNIVQDFRRRSRQ